MRINVLNKERKKSKMTNICDERGNPKDKRKTQNMKLSSHPNVLARERIV